MLLHGIDWACIIAFFVVSLLIGIVVSRRAGSSAAEFFAAGKHMPWWLLGVSMVATTFSTDTPNLVTDIVRKNGVMGNWVWWAFLLTGLLTVFIYAQLWKRSGVLTDVEFYELRYSGKTAAFLRGFRALYLGAFFNIFIMASVSLAAIKIGRILLGLTPIQTILIAATVTVIYSSMGGLRGVLITDFVQFILAMAGAIGAAYVSLQHPKVGGLSGLLHHEAVQGKLNMLPALTDTESLVTLLILPLAVQWWSMWYPGSEPGGGGYIAQRMLAAKDEKNALGAVFFFNAAHYALRPWPWILVALCSLVVFPDLDALREAFPKAGDVINDDLGYPAMLTFLPAGLLGLVVASLIAAYMSTISTHLNWGASYIVHDFYQRFIRPESSERELVRVGRICTAILMVCAGALALLLENALGNFQIMLQIGAGTGLLFILRWFWWRINAASELTAMVASFLVAIYLQFFHTRLGFSELSGSTNLLLGVGITTLCWLAVTFLTQPTEESVLINFCRMVHPGGPGWHHITQKAGELAIAEDKAWQVPKGILCMLLGSVSIYSTLFATGHWLYGNIGLAITLTAVALISAVILIRTWLRLLA